MATTASVTGGWRLSQLAFGEKLIKTKNLTETTANDVKWQSPHKDKAVCEGIKHGTFTNESGFCVPCESKSERGVFIFRLTGLIIFKKSVAKWVWLGLGKKKKLLG